MNRMLGSDLNLFSAAMMQATVEIWQEDSAGVYCFVDSGITEKYTPDRVKIRNKHGEAGIIFVTSPRIAQKIRPLTCNNVSGRCFLQTVEPAPEV